MMEPVCSELQGALYGAKAQIRREVHNAFKYRTLTIVYDSYLATINSFNVSLKQSKNYVQTVYYLIRDFAKG